MHGISVSLWIWHVTDTTRYEFGGWASIINKINSTRCCHVVIDVDCEPFGALYLEHSFHLE